MLSIGWWSDKDDADYSQTSRGTISLQYLIFPLFYLLFVPAYCHFLRQWTFFSLFWHSKHCEGLCYYYFFFVASTASLPLLLPGVTREGGREGGRCAVVSEWYRCCVCCVGCLGQSAVVPTAVCGKWLYLFYFINKHENWNGGLFTHTFCLLCFMDLLLLSTGCIRYWDTEEPEWGIVQCLGPGVEILWCWAGRGNIFPRVPPLISNVALHQGHPTVMHIFTSGLRHYNR